MGRNPLSSKGGKYCRPVLTWVCLVSLCLLVVVQYAGAAVFTQETFGVDFQGNALPQTVIDPAAWRDLSVHQYDLGAGRQLEIQTNLAPTRQAEIDSLAAVVYRCYVHLESATQRDIPGGVLLYLLEFEQRPRLYRFQTETQAADNWSQVRLAMLDRGEALLGEGSSHHVAEFVYDTLPHELTHNLLTTVPTLRHDRDGAAPQGTRWFIDGACEMLAKSFAAREAPDFWRQALVARRVSSALSNPELFDLVWRWGQQDDLSWSEESDLYGVSLLLLTAWTRQIELPTLLNLMSARGGDLDGADLSALLQETARLNRTDLTASAQKIGRQLWRRPTLSLRQAP